MNKILGLMIVSAITLSSSAFAMDDKEKAAHNLQGMTEQSMKSQGPCASDIRTYCNEVTPGKGRIVACLKAYEDKLSTGCQQQQQAMMSEFREVRKACQNDMKKFCKDSMVGTGSMLGCLKQHENELSQTCKNEMPSLKSTG